MYSHVTMTGERSQESLGGHDSQHEILYVPKFETVDALQDHLQGVYGERNQQHLNTLDDCIKLFAVGIRDVREALRGRSPEPRVLDVAFARLGARALAFAYIDNMNVSVCEGLEAKFPESGCAYCRQSPRVCDEDRAKAQLGWDAVGARKDWSLSDWQRYLYELYGDRNSSRGIDYVAGRLSDELTEVIALSHFAPRLPNSSLRRELQLEVADLIGWTCAAGSLLHTDVQQAVEWRYGDGCPTCGSAVCSCVDEQFDHVYDILG
jgi:hypothetical protein